ncbi:MAG: hypothetical protein WAJ87_18030, partial [Bryobacteraceae bacterium]
MPLVRVKSKEPAAKNRRCGGYGGAFFGSAGGLLPPVLCEPGRQIADAGRGMPRPYNGRGSDALTLQ